MNNPNISLSDSDVDEIETVLPDGTSSSIKISPTTQLQGLLIDWVVIPSLKLATFLVNWLNRQLLKLK